MRQLALRFQITDKPDPYRKFQREPIPYLGGLAIMLSLILMTVIGTLILDLSDALKEDIFFLLIPAITLGIVGLWDDIKNLSPEFRLMVQVIMGIIGSITISFGSTTGSVTGNSTLDLLVSIFWIVGITNAVNFFDNTDGGAAIACFFSAFGFFLYGLATGQPYISYFGLAIMGVLSGFFLWNRKPARIYMGDSGALFLGMLLATLAIRIDPVTDTRLASLTIPLLFLALPILDTTVVMIERIRSRRSPFKGGRDHLSHRLALKGIRHRHVLYRFAALSIVFQLPVFLILVTNAKGELFIAFVAALSFASLCLYFLRVEVRYDN